MEAGLDSILRRLKLLSGGSAGAGGHAASRGGRVQPVSCSLRQPPTGAAGAGSHPTVSGAGGSAYVVLVAGLLAVLPLVQVPVLPVVEGGSSPSPASLRWLPTGDAAADSSDGSGGAGGGACGRAAGGAARSAGGGAGGSAGGHQAFTFSLSRLKCLAWVFCPFLTLADAVATLALSAGVLEEALLGGSCSLPLLHAVAFFTLAGGGMVWSFAGVGGTLGVLTGAPFEPLGVAGTTADGDLMDEVLA
ncbi:hypothetical protein NDU88_001753 [Pleurodeles waltl]|uniref:Uncharacterized protein n=1 Tax=Pleurodeles waltl TaxID=8319 RepID=A0AAV7WNA3_PLEWA|nr:hypothetical protein NDU88_001753 [Pleurodeles waltl]